MLFIMDFNNRYHMTDSDLFLADISETASREFDWH